MSTVYLTNEELPIILVRGWGGLDIGDVQAQTHQGFNIGTVYTHKKGPNFIYKGMVIKFLDDGHHEYADATNAIRYSADEFVSYGEEPDIQAKVIKNPQTLWVFRYYDFENRNLEFYGNKLKEAITKIKELTGAPKVNIIAHSMGGLIVRWLLQKEYKTRPKGHAEVNKVVTIGTPHGGISFAGWAEDLKLGMELTYFDQGWIKKNLGGTKKKWNDISESFDPKAFLCIVGTDRHSYELKVSKFMAGKHSDGLVKQDNAILKDANVAYVHKCHGGSDSLVTSRETYELATRFFFGNLKVKITQVSGRILGKYEWVSKPEYFLGFSLKPRGIDFYLNEQSKDAENCHGPFRSNKLKKNLSAFQGFLDTERISEAAKVFKDIAWRFDIYIGERDLKGILGFSDTKILEAQALFRYLLEDKKLLFYNHFINQDKGPDVEIPLELPVNGSSSAQFDVKYDTYEATFKVELEDVTSIPVELSE